MGLGIEPWFGTGGQGYREVTARVGTKAGVRALSALARTPVYSERCIGGRGYVVFPLGVSYRHTTWVGDMVRYTYHMCRIWYGTQS